MATHRRDRDDDFDDDRPARRRRDEYDDRDDFSSGSSRGPVRKGVNVCGVIALIMGIIGLIFSLIPCVGAFIGIPLAAIGLLLGIIGIFTAGQTTGRGLPIAGTVVSLAGLLIAGAWLTFFAVVGKKSQEEAAARMEQAEADFKVAQERERQREKDLREGPAIQVTAEKLYEDFDANAISAEAKYKDKVLEITGPVLKTPEDKFGRLTLDLDAGKDGMIVCEFPRNAKAELEKLKPLQKVTIRGRCTGRDRNKDVIKVEDCFVVSKKKD